MCPHRQRPPDDMRQQATVVPCSAGRGAAKFTPIYSGLCIFYGVFTSDLRYSRRILGFFLPTFGRISRDFGPKMDEIGVIWGTRRQLCDICQQTNGLPCGTVLNWPLAAPAPAPGCRANFIRVRFISVACDCSRGKCPAWYMAVRAFSRSLGVYGICTEMYGFCTVFVRFCTEKRRKTGKNGHVRASTGERQGAGCTPRRAPGLQADPEFGERWQIALDTGGGQPGRRAAAPRRVAMVAEVVAVAGVRAGPVAAAPGLIRKRREAPPCGVPRPQGLAFAYESIAPTDFPVPTGSSHRAPAREPVSDIRRRIPEWGDCQPLLPQSQTRRQSRINDGPLHWQQDVLQGDAL